MAAGWVAAAAPAAPAAGLVGAGGGTTVGAVGVASGPLAHEINRARASIAAVRPPTAFRVCVICRSGRTMPILSCSEPAPFQ